MKSTLFQVCYCCCGGGGGGCGGGGGGNGKLILQFVIIKILNKKFKDFIWVHMMKTGI